MRKAMEWLALTLVVLVLRELLSPVLAPVFGPVLPTVGGLIQSTMVRQTDAALTVATRYAAAGYRDAADVLLAFISWLVVVGVAIGGGCGPESPPTPDRTGPKTIRDQHARGPCRARVRLSRVCASH
jgi:hypothetical protein